MQRRKIENSIYFLATVDAFYYLIHIDLFDLSEALSLSGIKSAFMTIFFPQALNVLLILQCYTELLAFGTQHVSMRPHVNISVQYQNSTFQLFNYHRKTMFNANRATFRDELFGLYQNILTALRSKPFYQTLTFV